MIDLARLDALGQAELVRWGEVTALELVEAAIERIEALNPKLNAVVTTLYDRALRRAAGALPASPLAGVPFLLKDLGVSLAGVRQTSGSKALLDHVASADSEYVRRLELAGVVVVAVTSTPEFGNHSTTEPALFGTARKPMNLSRTTGGSSGGSAAAVAARLVPAAHGTDGAGSIRIPASCCGVFGLKTTRGRNSAAPAGESLAGLSGDHVLTVSVRDSAAFLDATAGWAPGDPYTAPAPARSFLQEVATDPGVLRIAWTTEPPFEADVDAECVRAVQETVELLSELGHEVQEARPTFDGTVLLEPFARIWAIANAHDVRDITRLLGREIPPDELEETTWELVEYGRRFDAVDLLEAQGQLARASHQIAPFFERYDVWVTPTLARPPEPLGVLNRSHGGALEWWVADGRFNPWNPIANMTGHPAASVPLTWSRDGLPIGILLTGRFADEATLFRLAGQLEAARPWADRLPPVNASAEQEAPAAAHSALRQ